MADIEDRESVTMRFPARCRASAVDGRAASVQKREMEFSENVSYRQFYADGPWQLDNKVVHESDYLMFDHLRNRRPVILDVGANKGQSIASFLTIFPEATIHSFECNPVMRAVLNNLKAVRPDACRNVYVHEYGLAAQDDTLMFSMPVVDGVYYFEETTCEPEIEFEKHKARYASYGTNLTSYDFSALVRRGDGLGLEADIIKIDTEGAEPKIVEGLVETIKARRPPILSETSCFLEVNAVLLPIGYRCYMPDDDGRIVPVSCGRGNVLYVHPETRDAFKAGTFTP